MDDGERFPDAPHSSWITEEGWLVVGGEAWTEEEWNGSVGRQWRNERPHRVPVCEPA